MEGRVQIRQSQRRVGREAHGTVVSELDVLVERIAPRRILDRVEHAVLAPARPAVDAVHDLQVALGARIVGRHRRVVRIVWIIESAARVDVDAVVADGPAGIAVPFGDGAVGVFVRLRSIVGPRTPADSPQNNERNEGPDRAPRWNQQATTSTKTSARTTRHRMGAGSPATRRSARCGAACRSMSAGIE